MSYQELYTCIQRSIPKRYDINQQRCRDCRDGTLCALRRNDDGHLLDLGEHLQRPILRLCESSMEEVQGRATVKEAFRDGCVDELVAGLENALVKHVSEETSRVVSTDVVVAARVDAQDKRELGFLETYDAVLQGRVQGRVRGKNDDLDTYI